PGDRPLRDFPVRIESIRPHDIYPIPGGYHERWKAVIHFSSMKVFEVEELYNVRLTVCDEDVPDEWDYAEDGMFDFTQPLNPGQEVNVVDYWCWDGDQIMHATIAHNQFVMRPVHMKNYDSLPFTIFFCAPTTSTRGEYYGLGINYALVDSVAEI